VGEKANRTEGRGEKKKKKKKKKKKERGRRGVGGDRGPL